MYSDVHDLDAAPCGGRLQRVLVSSASRSSYEGYGDGLANTRPGRALVEWSRLGHLREAFDIRDPTSDRCCQVASGHFRHRFVVNAVTPD